MKCSSRAKNSSALHSLAQSRGEPKGFFYLPSEAQQYDVYCWAIDSAVDTAGLARPNYMTQSHAITEVNSTTSPAGGALSQKVPKFCGPSRLVPAGRTRGVWVVDSTAPQIILVGAEAPRPEWGFLHAPSSSLSRGRPAAEAVSSSELQVTLQLNEPGTAWPSVSAFRFCTRGLRCFTQRFGVNQAGRGRPRSVLSDVRTGSSVAGDTSGDATQCQSSEVQNLSSTTDCFWITLIQSNDFHADVHEAFVDVSINMNLLHPHQGQVASLLSPETTYEIFCYAEDDWPTQVNRVWKQESTTHSKLSRSFCLGPFGP